MACGGERVSASEERIVLPLRGVEGRVLLSYEEVGVGGSELGCLKDLLRGRDTWQTAGYSF